MVRKVCKVNSKCSNKFMTTEELNVLWQYASRWDRKFQLILGFAAFRGLRIGEILAININDFTPDFSKVYVILEKTNIGDWLPLPEGFSMFVKDYCMMNRHRFKDGYIFPFYSKSREKMPHLDTKTAEALISKIRKIIGAEYPKFLEIVWQTQERHRYRIGFHTLRRWHETHIWDIKHDHLLIADLMRYKDKTTPFTYISPYEHWKNEKDVMNHCFSPVYNKFQMGSVGQTKLSQF